MTYSGALVLGVDAMASHETSNHPIQGLDCVPAGRHDYSVSHGLGSGKLTGP